MRYYRLPGEERSATDTLVVEDEDSITYNLTSASPDLGSFKALARAANANDESLDAVTRKRLHHADRIELDTGDKELLQPVIADEVWAAGVTYRISEEARKAESGKPDVYIDVYDNERPEIFLKATPSRTVGPSEDIGVRGDSEWNVPEPELGVVLHRGNIVGYTIGNDVSSRDIEGENPLYLPQAKIYDRCCSIGPCIATDETVENPHDLGMSLIIERDEETIYEGSTSTSEMATTCEKLVSYLNRHNTLPETVVLLTGTALVPPDSYTLTDGDTVIIDLENIGRLMNTTITV